MGLSFLGYCIERGNQKEEQEEQMGNVPPDGTITAAPAVKEFAEL